MTAVAASILVIDDNDQVLNGLSDNLRRELANEAVDIRTWMPAQADDDPEAAFKSKLDGGTALVVTDYDLTTKGLRGLFGVSIVAWSQMAAIPVGDFSRGHKDSLPKEPNLFELKVPPNDEEGAAFIAGIYRGFRDLDIALTRAEEELRDRRSLAATLATVLGRPHLESQFALYMSRLGSANSSLVERIRTLGTDGQHDTQAVQNLMRYVLGHVLANSVLRFPGPLLNDRALAAYCGTHLSEANTLAEVFQAASYTGPFSSMGRSYWREDVDEVIDALEPPETTEPHASFADYNRVAVQHALGRELARHDCDRCNGLKGGFWCPFTKRAVCERSDCSVPSSSWIPQGAQLTRVERDFYDELAPLLGL